MKARKREREENHRKRMEKKPDKVKRQAKGKQSKAQPTKNESRTAKDGDSDVEEDLANLF